jgi:hypothetical protein
VFHSKTETAVWPNRSSSLYYLKTGIVVGLKGSNETLLIRLFKRRYWPLVHMVSKCMVPVVGPTVQHEASSKLCCLYHTITSLCVGSAAG